MWKVIVGILLLVVLIAAVVVLIVTSVSDADTDTTKKPDDKDNTNISSNEGVTSVDSEKDNEKDNENESGEGESGNTETNPGEGSGETGSGETETQTPSAAVTGVMITYNGHQISSVDPNTGVREFTMQVNESLTLGVRITPDEVADSATVKWESSNEDCVVVLQSGKVTALASGTATLTVTVDGVTDEVLVRVARR